MKLLLICLLGFLVGDMTTAYLNESVISANTFHNSILMFMGALVYYGNLKMFWGGKLE